jgi:hypothetical protein
MPYAATWATRLRPGSRLAIAVPDLCDVLRRLVAAGTLELRRKPTARRPALYVPGPGALVEPPHGTGGVEAAGGLVGQHDEPVADGRRVLAVEPQREQLDDAPVASAELVGVGAGLRAVVGGAAGIVVGHPANGRAAAGGEGL